MDLFPAKKEKKSNVGVVYYDLQDVLSVNKILSQKKHDLLID